MNEFKIRLVHLHHCRGISWDLIYTILKQDPQLQNLYSHSINRLYFSRNHPLQPFLMICTLQSFETISYNMKISILRLQLSLIMNIHLYYVKL